MPYPAAREHPESKPCVKNVRGKSVGVRAAAKKTAPRRRPAADNECHRSVFIAGSRLVAIVLRSKSGQEAPLNGFQQSRKHKRQLRTYNRVQSPPTRRSKQIRFGCEPQYLQPLHGEVRAEREQPQKRR